MRYYKNIDEDYILAIGTGNGGTEITESEYNEIMQIIHSKPETTDTIDYKLKQDLTWEEFEIEVISDDEPTVEERSEAYDILMGVTE